MKTLVTLAALIGLSACGGAETLAVPSGPVFALNTGHWRPAPADLLLPKPGGTE